MRYYVDGYNVLHKSKTLRPLLHASIERAREALIDRLAEYCTATHQEVILVFDGQSGHQASLADHYRGVASLTVLYAPARHSADAEIERRVYLEPRKLEVVVVSNDRGLRDLCRGMGALTMEADSFLATTRETRRDIEDTLTRTRAPRHASIEEGLSQRSRDTLKALRDKLR